MTEKRAENIMIPEEANYQRTMKCDVEPYLRNCEKDGYIESYDKTAIYYRTYRIPLAKAAIVISHGFCEFAEKYKEVIYYFLKNGYSVYVPEHRGHGYSDRIVVDGEKVHIEDYEQYVQDLHFFVRSGLRKLPQIFSARSERERNMLPDRVVFQTNHPLKQAAVFPENDTCISTTCVCGISITRLTVEPMPG